MKRHIKKLLVLVGVSLSLATIPDSAEAKRGQVDLVPHGDTFSCLLCHTNSRGDQTNAFGAQVRSTAIGGDANWSALAALDADGDEYTNGYELGDPDGTWQVGDPNPVGEIWHPSDLNDNPCGNDIVEGPETCDGPTLPTCQELGYVSGELVCSACRLDESACEAGTTEPDVGSGEPDAGSDSDTSDDSDMGTTPDTAQPTDADSSDESCATAKVRPTFTSAFLAIFLIVMVGMRRITRKKGLEG